MAITGYSGNWNVKAEVYEVSGSVDIANNTSIVRVDLYVGRNANLGTSYIWGDFSGSISVDGQTQAFSGNTNGQQYLNGGSYWYTGVTRDFLIPHNNDGSKTVGISFNWSANFSPYSTNPNGTLGLTTIPRKTDCPSLSVIVKTPTSLTISPKASNTFQHSLQILCGNLSYYVNANGNMQSSEYKFGTNVTQIPITIPASFYSQFSGINGQGMLRLRTYNGNTYIDQSDATLYVKVNEDLCRPYIDNYILYDTNQKTIAITENINNVIQYASRIQGYISNYYISDPDDTNTTITSKTIPSINYTIPSDNSIVINQPTANAFSVSLKNSRTITGQSEIRTSGNLIPYIPLTFNIESLKRPEPTTGEIEISYNGNYYAQPFSEEPYGYFVVGDTMSSSNTGVYLPDNFYEQMDQNAHHTVFMTGPEYVVADDTTVVTIDANTVEKSYNLAIYNADYSTVYIPYEVNVRYTNGVVTSVDVVSNDRRLLIGAGTLSSVDTSNIFYEHIHNTDKDDETYYLMNTLKITWQYREKGSNTWITGGTLTPIINAQNNTYSGTASLGMIFDYQKQYEFLFTAEDLLFNSKGDGTDYNPINPIQVQEQVTRGLPIFWWGQDNVNMVAKTFLNGGCFDYSEEEMFTGKYWHDGRKIYKVDLIVDQNTGGDVTQISSSSITDGLDYVTDISGIVVVMGSFDPPMSLIGAIAKLPFQDQGVASSWAVATFIGGANSYIRVASGAGMNYPRFYIRVEYVKIEENEED